MKEFIKNWAVIIVAATFFLLYVGKGCTGSKIVATNNNIDSIKIELNILQDNIDARLKELEAKTIHHKQMRDEMERVMYNFLIYEDDLDKGKISLSAIKSKIEEND